TAPGKPAAGGPDPAPAGSLHSGFLGRIFTLSVIARRSLGAPAGMAGCRTPGTIAVPGGGRRISTPARQEALQGVAGNRRRPGSHEKRYAGLVRLELVRNMEVSRARRQRAGGLDSDPEGYTSSGSAFRAVDRFCRAGQQLRSGRASVVRSLVALVFRRVLA